MGSSKTNQWVGVLGGAYQDELITVETNQRSSRVVEAVRDQESDVAVRRGIPRELFGVRGEVSTKVSCKCCV